MVNLIVVVVMTSAIGWSQGWSWFQWWIAVDIGMAAATLRDIEEHLRKRA